MTKLIGNYLSYFIVIFFCMVTVGCGGSEENQHVQFSQPFSQLLIYPKKNKLPKFQLFKHDQTVFNESNFQGRWNFIFMGYTHCPDVCPITLLDLDKIYQQISTDLQNQFQFVFLSVDPKRDTLEHMASYISHFNDDFVGITGDKKEIDVLVQSLGGIYTLNEQEGEFYSVDHSSRIFIISPYGERFGIITSEAMQNKGKSLLVEELSELASSDIRKY